MWEEAAQVNRKANQEIAAMVPLSEARANDTAEPGKEGVVGVGLNVARPEK